MTTNTHQSRLKSILNRLVASRTTDARKDAEKFRLNNDMSFAMISSIASYSKHVDKKVNNEFASLKRDRRILVTLNNAVRQQSQLLTKTVKANKTDEVKDPLELFKKKNAPGGSLLGALGLGAAIISKVFGIIAKPIITILGKLSKSIVKIASRLGVGLFAKGASSAWKFIKSVKGKLGSALSGAYNTIKSKSTKTVVSRVTSGTISRVASQILVRLGLGAAASITGTGAAIVAGVGILASAVGIGSYKLAKYFDLAGKLDNLISSVTSGKYRDLSDILLGIKSGDITSDITTWIKENTINFFKSGYDYIRNKISILLSKLNPFSRKDSAQLETVKNAKLSGSSIVATKTSILSPSKQEESEIVAIDSSNQLNQPIASVVSQSTAPSVMQTIGNYAQRAFSLSPIGIATSAAKSAINVASNLFGKGGESPDETASTDNGPRNTAGGVLTHKPVEGGKYTSGFGYRNHPLNGKRKLHGGIDVAVPTGTNLFAAASGRVTRVGWQNPADKSEGYGMRVYIDHGNGLQTIYAHMSSFAVKVGDQVKGGQVIGKSGNTGGSTGPHLHFEVVKNGKKQNPKQYLSGIGGTDSGISPRAVDKSYTEAKKRIRKIKQSYSPDTNVHQVPNTVMPKQHNNNQKMNNSAIGSTITTTAANVRNPRIASSAITMATNSVTYT